MSRGLQGAILRGFGARDHTATVIETVYIAPHFVRVRMVSPTPAEATSLTHQREAEWRVFAE